MFTAPPESNKLNTAWVVSYEPDDGVDTDGAVKDPRAAHELSSIALNEPAGLYTDSM